MSKTSDKPEGRAARGSGGSAAQAIFAKGMAAAIGLVVLVAFIWAMLPRETPDAPKETAAAAHAPPAQAAPAGQPKPEHQKLVGKWLRPDGDYVLALKSVDAAGKLEASYFNPSPINVSRAYAWQDAGATKVFVELRGAGYPGSTYTLTYDAQRDVLQGVYFQAAMQQEFEIFFVRAKENE